MSTIFSIFLFNFKSTFRNFKATGIMFILPLVFMAIFGLAFGGPNKIEFKLGIYQENSQNSQVDLEKIFKEADQNSENLVITTSKYDNLETLKSDLKNEKINIGINFTPPVSPLISPKFEVLTDSQNVNSTIYRSVVSDILIDVLYQGQNPITTTVINPQKADFNGFDYLAPGLIIYGLIILIPGIAQSFTEISQKRHIFRYAVSKVNSLEIILGSVLFYFLLGLIQIVILYFTALAFGYQASGNLAVAIIPALLSLLFVIATGLLIGSFFNKTDAATNTGTIINIIFGFFSGSFIANIGGLLKFNILENEIQFNDFLPTKWGTVAVEKILSQDLSLVDIQKELWILGISGIITILIGIWVYSNKQLKNQF